MSEQGTFVAKSRTLGFEEAFLLHHRTVFRAARSIVSDPFLAEDVTQETFIKLYDNLDSIDCDEMLRPWLIKVAMNLARNALRTKIRANNRDENYVKETTENEIYSIEEDFEQRQGVSDIVKALNQIKEPLRSCLILKQQGLSYKEIAQSLDLNEASIGTFIARARAEFARLYGREK